MPLSGLLPQISLAVTVLAATAGTCVAFLPPNHNPKEKSSTRDSIRWMTEKHTIEIALIPLMGLALHTTSLILFYPDIPETVLGFAAVNRIDPSLITWSPATWIPLALILCAGVPLRLISYSSLGKNFTFALSEPDALKTTGIYQYVQHPSYTGLAILIVANFALFGRLEGVFSCWIPPPWHVWLKNFEAAHAVVFLSCIMFAIRTRVKDEEHMLRNKFQGEWERWHTRTARFIPWLLWA